MNTYVIMLRYTQQGAQNIKQAPTRLDATKKMFESMGGKYPRMAPDVWAV